MTRRMGDSANPPGTYPTGAGACDAWGIYIDGDTPHVWTAAEIAAVPCRWLLPIYVCDNPAQRNPTSDAAAAVAWLRTHHVPAGSALALDYEMAVNAAYVTTFDKAVTAAGWTLLLYGSQSYVIRNPRPSAGYWTASWSGFPHLDPGAAATQYIGDTQLGKPYDLSLVADSLVLWDTQGHTAQAATAARDWRQDMLHLDLNPGDIKVFTPPAAVVGGACTLTLSTDFGDGAATIRVAIYSFKDQGWTVNSYPLEATGGAASIPLTADANKVSLVHESGGGIVGADVYPT